MFDPVTRFDLLLAVLAIGLVRLVYKLFDYLFDVKYERVRGVNARLKAEAQWQGLVEGRDRDYV